MAKPLVAIVGRPNVGKSTFFNKIAGRRISIVEDVPGVTRDRIYCDVEWMGRHFSMVETGGLDMRSEDVGLVHARREGCATVYTINREIWPGVEALLHAICRAVKGEKARE